MIPVSFERTQQNTSVRAQSYTAGTNPNPLMSPGNHKKFKSPSAFLLDFPMKTNYMYGRMKRSVVNEIFALTICLWVKAGSGPGLGTPFSYAVQGQANELVLIEWGSNPMELLINDKVNLTDGIKANTLCFVRMSKFCFFLSFGPYARAGPTGTVALVVLFVL